jgi:hypothetical protein
MANRSQVGPFYRACKVVSVRLIGLRKVVDYDIRYGEEERSSVNVGFAF